MSPYKGQDLSLYTVVGRNITCSSYEAQLERGPRGSNPFEHCCQGALIDKETGSRAREVLAVASFPSKHLGMIPSKSQSVEVAFGPEVQGLDVQTWKCLAVTGRVSVGAGSRDRS